MALKEIWHHFFGTIEPQMQTSVLDQLASAGVKTSCFAPDTTSGSGIVFFHEVTASLHEFVRDVSRYGLERVLLVSLSEAKLPSAAIWNFLQSGAADVF